MQEQQTQQLYSKECPECGATGITKSADGTFCASCGVEIDDVNLYTGGFIPRCAKKEIVQYTPVQIHFLIKPKYEMFSLIVGLKNNKLATDWIDQLGMPEAFAKSMKQNGIKGDSKKQAIYYINNAFAKKRDVLFDAARRFESNWSLIAKQYFVRVAQLTDLDWQRDEYFCYPSLACFGGFSNTAKNCVILQYRWDKGSNYVLAHELFHIHFKEIIEATFTAGFEDQTDRNLSEVVVDFVLLDEMGNLFDDKQFDLNSYETEEQRLLANKLYALWKERKSFHDFLIASYELMGIDKEQKEWLNE